MCRDVLDLTLPVIEDVDLETLIDQRATSVVRALETPPAGHTGGGNGNNGLSRVQIVVQFCETKRKKTYFFGSAEDQVCWEQWIVEVVCARPKTETGTLDRAESLLCRNTLSRSRMVAKLMRYAGTENRKVRLAMEKSLQKAATKIVNIVNRDIDHIPPITVSKQNPFPYQIHVNPKLDSWGGRMSIF